MLEDSTPAAASRYGSSTTDGGAAASDSDAPASSACGCSGAREDESSRAGSAASPVVLSWRNGPVARLSCSTCAKRTLERSASCYATCVFWMACANSVVLWTTEVAAEGAGVTEAEEEQVEK